MRRSLLDMERGEPAAHRAGEYREEREEDAAGVEHRLSHADAEDGGDAQAREPDREAVRHHRPLGETRGGVGADDAEQQATHRVEQLADALDVERVPGAVVHGSQGNAHQAGNHNPQRERPDLIDEDADDHGAGVEAGSALHCLDHRHASPAR
ncbi:MAG: hypothetical protein ABIT71_07815 [Vicinamibacteraceae bacterium]